MSSNQTIREGSKVTTLRGSRFTGPFTGTVVGLSKSVWGRTAMVKKSDGKVVRCLVRNLVQGTKATKKKVVSKKK